MVVSADRSSFTLEPFVQPPTAAWGWYLLFGCQPGIDRHNDPNRVVDHSIFPENMEHLKPGVQVFRHRQTMPLQMCWSRAKSVRKIGVEMRLAAAANGLSFNHFQRDDMRLTQFEKSNCRLHYRQPKPRKPFCASFKNWARPILDVRVWKFPWIPCPSFRSQS